jgi:outer membrane protein OmpA-like peptidoglycan-associated protein
MRKAALALLVAPMIMLPAAAPAQDSAVTSPDEFVCALAPEGCPDDAAQAEDVSEPATEPGRPRISATRGFSLSRPNAQPTPPQATPNRQTQTTASSRTRQARQSRQSRQTRQARQTRPVQPAGRVDLRLAFQSGSSELSAADQARVLAFAEALKRPQLANVRVRIEGHTDSSGGRAVNLALSQRRAQAVADFLVSQGIAAERLEVRGYGFDRPLPGRRASAGENRRVEAVRIS